MNKDDRKDIEFDREFKRVVINKDDQEVIGRICKRFQDFFERHKDSDPKTIYEEGTNEWTRAVIYLQNYAIKIGNTEIRIADIESAWDEKIETPPYQEGIETIKDYNSRLKKRLLDPREWEAYLKASKMGVAHALHHPNLTFAFPSHELMFTLIALFAGKPERIPRKILDKPKHKRTPGEQQQADEFLNAVLKKETKTTYSNAGKPVTEETRWAIVSDNPKVEAKAQITDTFFSQDLYYREAALAMHIKRAYGPEGLRHLLGLIIGLEENRRRGSFVWSVNEHLERLGYRRKKSGSFDLELKKTSIEIVDTLCSLILTASAKKGNREVIAEERLFLWDKRLTAKKDGALVDRKIKLTATDFWYQDAIDPTDNKNKMFTKLLKKIAQENHRNHPLTIYLAPLLAIFWRQNTEQIISVEKLLDWCDLKIKGHHRMYHLRDLEAELDYMKNHGYLGDWINSGEHLRPSQCKKPFDCVLTLIPPEWLKKDLQEIQSKKQQYLPETNNDEVLTREQFVDILNNSGESINNFANIIGKSRQMVSYIKNGQRKVTPEISRKIRDKFPNLM